MSVRERERGERESKRERGKREKERERERERERRKRERERERERTLAREQPIPLWSLSCNGSPSYNRIFFSAFSAQDFNICTE